MNIILIILGLIVVVQTVILIISQKCPSCGHRTFKRPYDIFYLKDRTFGRIKVGKYTCEKCKNNFEKEL